MQNLHDTPARYEENNDYMRDPDSPSSKPYSTKQKAANDEHKQRETLYHIDQGAKKFNKEDVAEALDNGWRDTPFFHPRHPEVLIDEEGGETVIPEKIQEEVADAEMDILRDEAVKLGVKVDKRWGKAKLQSEILAAS